MRRDTHLPNGLATLGGLAHDAAAGANLAADHAAEGDGLRRRGRRPARLRPLRQLRRPRPGSRLRQQPPAVHRPRRRHDRPGPRLAPPLRRALLSPPTSSWPPP